MDLRIGGTMKNPTRVKTARHVTVQMRILLRWRMRNCAKRIMASLQPEEKMRTAHLCEGGRSGAGAPGTAGQ
jgi:hypothetical protein